MVNQHTRKSLWLAWRFGLRLQDGCRKGLDTCKFFNCKVYCIRKPYAGEIECADEPILPLKSWLRENRAYIPE